MATNQIKAGIVLNYVMIGLNALIGLSYTPYMLRMLGQNEYGLYSLAGSVIAYLSLLDFGLGDATIRYTAKFRAEGKSEEQYSLFGVLTLLYSIIGIITLIGGVYLYFNVDTIFSRTFTPVELEEAKTLILIMVFNLAVSFPLGIYQGIITAYEDFIFLKVVAIARLLLSTAVMIIILHFGYKAIGLCIVQTIFNIAVLLINFVYCFSRIKIRIKFTKTQMSFLRELTVFSLWVAIGAITDRFYWSTGQFVLGAIAGTAEVSIFSLAITLQWIYMSFSSAISGVLLPKITAIVSQGDDDKRISDIFIRTGRLQYAVLSILLSGLIVFGKQFISIWAGDGYENTYYIAVMFFAVLTVPLTQNVGLSILKARNNMKFRSLSYLIFAAIGLLLQIILSKYYGAIGCAIGVSVSIILGQWFTMNLYYHLSQRINILQFWWEIVKMSIGPAILTLVGYWVVERYQLDTVMSLGAGITIFAIVYCLIIWFTSFNRSERSTLLTPLKKHSGR